MISLRVKALHLLCMSRENSFLMCREIEAIAFSISASKNDYRDHITRAAFNIRENKTIGAEVVQSLDCEITNGTLVGRIDMETKSRNDRFQQMLQEKYESLNDVKFQAIVRCKRCGSEEVSWEEKQTRGADEAATVFCVCTTCKNRWVMR